MFDFPQLLYNKEYIDDRGVLNFNDNEYMQELFKTFKRFYKVSNHEINTVRAWHGHLNEAKLFYVIDGKFKVGITNIDNFNIVPIEDDIETHYLSNSELLFVPSGYVNGFMNLTKNNSLLVFSNSNTDESKKDDHRFPWNCIENYWKIKYR